MPALHRPLNHPAPPTSGVPQSAPAPAQRPFRRVLGLAGSLRTGSYNRLLLRAAAERAPASMALTIFEELSTLPLFDEDLELATGGGPDAVRRLREEIALADGLLIATPEYNQSMPGVLKNALDWLARPAPDRVLAGKPVAVVGASTGMWGTRLAQSSLRQVLTASECLVLPAPSVFVRDAAALFGDDGRLLDERTGHVLSAMLSAFDRWIERVAPVPVDVALAK